MISIHSGHIWFEVLLDNGLYRFVNPSGSGKTYMGKYIISPLYQGGYNYLYITYQRGNTSERYIQELTKDKFSLIFVDRYDLYESKIITSLLTDLAKEAVVLVDIKHPTFGEYKIADIDFVQIGRVLVYDNDIRRFREVEDKRLALENG